MTVKLLLALAALASAVWAWWASPQQQRTRIEKELDELHKDIEAVRRESDKALAAHDTDRVTRYDFVLTGLRYRERVLLQRLGKTIC